MKELTLIKIGGNVIDNERDLQKFLLAFSKVKGPKILVHGGGKLATDLSAKLGIRTKFVEGRRVTDANTLKIVTMVYTGWINKSIVCKLNSKGTKAIGLCGADVSLIPANKRKKIGIDYGFVGDIVPKNINTQFLEDLINQNITPVIAPITGSSNGQLLNTNADTIASALVSSLSSHFKVKFIYCFEKDGVLDNNKVIKIINEEMFMELKQKGIIKDGMIPKLENAFKAFNKGASVTIGNSDLLQKLILKNAGTHIAK